MKLEDRSKKPEIRRKKLEDRSRREGEGSKTALAIAADGCWLTCFLSPLTEVDGNEQPMNKRIYQTQFPLPSTSVDCGSCFR